MKQIPLRSVSVRSREMTTAVRASTGEEDSILRSERKAWLRPIKLAKCVLNNIYFVTQPETVTLTPHSD